MTKAAASVNTALAMSTFATVSVEQVADAASDAARFLQLYLCRDRDISRHLISRVERAGMPNIGKDGIATVSDVANSYIDPTMTWDIITWLKSISQLPVVIKGILSVEDAVEAVKRGVSGIVVSNHGGRQMDTAPAALDVLSEVVAAVDGRCEVYLDGGVRTGTDVFKALALGAKAVFIGRPVIYGLAYNGEAGVRQVLSIIRDEFRTAMMLAGCCSVDDIKPSYIRRHPQSLLPTSRL